jgi:type II secretory pathway pseudopilin PulG
MKSRTTRQSGVALAVTLLMLGLLMVIGVSAVMMSSTHFRQIANQQAENELRMALLGELEAHASNSGHLKNLGLYPLTKSVSVNGHTVTIEIGTPIHVGSIPVTGSSNTIAVIELCGRGTDTVTGASMTYHVGVSIPFAPDVPKTGSPCPP